MHKLRESNDLLPCHKSEPGAGVLLGLAHQCRDGQHQHLLQDAHLHLARQPRIRAALGGQSRHYPSRREKNKSRYRAKRCSEPAQPRQHARGCRLRGADQYRLATPACQPRYRQHQFRGLVHFWWAGGSSVARDVLDLPARQLHPRIGQASVFANRRDQIWQTDSRSHHQTRSKLGACSTLRFRFHELHSTQQRHGGATH